jgi:hypothetical protein
MASDLIFGAAGDGGYTPYLYCAGINGGDPIAVYFPSMPDSLEIARKNDFYINDKIPLYPDGLIAIYQGSDPIRVPITFEVHASDPRCPNGPVTLAEAAAAIHAMAMPAIPDSAISGLGLAVTPGKSTSDSAIASGSGSTLGQGGASSIAATSGGSSAYYMPPMVQLMMFDSQTNGTASSIPAGFGINMTGFIEDVKTTGRKPWLRAQGFSGRLASSMEYSFTFVFFPSYTGYVPNGQSSTNYKAVTSTGPRVLKYFYGSQAVISNSGIAATPNTGDASTTTSPASAVVPPTNTGGTLNLPVTVIPGTTSKGQVIPNYYSGNGSGNLPVERM